jgi:hypothetical protein
MNTATKFFIAIFVLVLTVSICFGNDKTLPFVVPAKAVEIPHGTLDCYHPLTGHTVSLKGKIYVHGVVFIVENRDGTTIVSVEKCVARGN